MLSRPLNHTSTFKAIGNTAQVLENVTWTKVLLNGAETWDQFSEFASSTFTATVPGYYQFNGAVGLTSSTGITVALYQNGVLSSSVGLMTAFGASVSSILKLSINQTVELYVLVTGTPTTDPTLNRLDGYLLATV